MARFLQSAERDRNRLRELLAHIPAGIGLTSGPDHRWTFINEDYLRLARRLKASDFIGKPAREAMPGMNDQGFPDLLDQVYRSGQPYFGRGVKASVDRATRGLPEEGYFDFLYHPMRDTAGEVEGIFIYAVEVTGMVAARKSIEDNAERLRLAQSAAQIGVWEWDPIRDISLLSDELHRMFATDPSDPDRVAKWTTRIHPADRARVLMLMIEGHRLGTMEFEYRYLHPQMGQRWLFCKGLRRPTETRMFGIVQDLTVRKDAEVAAQRLAAIVESSDDAIVSKDLNGIVTSWNSGAERIFGYTADEMIGQPITKIIPADLYGDETRILSTIARGERIDHFETVRVKKNGEQIEVSLTVSPVKDESGKIVGAAKIARDITQQKKAERALRTSERLASVGRLAATVAHEINNPLEAVTNLIYLARSAEDPSNYLRMAEEELERVSHLTRQTLGFYRETKSASGVRLGELVESLLTVFTQRMRNRGIALQTDIDNEIEINAVPGEIRQVIANLISNSIDALKTGGRIRIRVSGSHQRRDVPVAGVRLSIADTGIGIPLEAREHLFEPFFTTKKDIGTGLGLWICKSIIENHNGTIRVHSDTRPGASGTVFSIFLPTGEKEPQVTAEIQSLRPAV
jgi:PAS domain S-box-containing protein